MYHFSQIVKCKSSNKVSPEKYIAEDPNKPLEHTCTAFNFLKNTFISNKADFKELLNKKHTDIKFEFGFYIFLFSTIRFDVHRHVVKMVFDFPKVHIGIRIPLKFGKWIGWYSHKTKIAKI